MKVTAPEGIRGNDAGERVFEELHDVAERARWRMADVPWHAVERERATPELVLLVREIAASEATTFSATQRFLVDFADDLELSSWMSIWFYEETRHPHVLLRWLAAVGARASHEPMRRARVTAPFMRSRMATLVTNLVSEMVASARYRSLAERSPEPVLAHVAACLASDEARHAASFFRFARRRLRTSATPDVDRRDALKVLHLWTSERDRVQHPVSLFPSALPAGVQARVIRTVGLLVGEPLRQPGDVMDRLKGGSDGPS